MDLKLSDHLPMAAEVAALDRVVPSGQRHPRHQLLPALHALNDAVGWISRGGINEVSRRLDVAPAEVYGVASFYAMFSFTPRAIHAEQVCIDLACLVASEGGRVAVPEDAIASPCLGLCERAPARMQVSDRRVPAEAVARAGRLMARIGAIDPTSIEAYEAEGGYRALRRAVEIGAAKVVEEVTAAGLVGRGGAAFPTGRKWAAVAAEPARPHYVVCNADESEPGTFKDRVLLEGDPFSIIEAMTIAAFATGCEHGYIYLRGEYPQALATLESALHAARASGALGRDVLGLGFAFDIEIRRGAGAYICGEETAIFNSIEGFRGEPRNKPPFPTQVGLFGQPTLVNNVETLANVLPIVLEGGEAFRRAETKLFCVSGAVQRPGVYEVPVGTTLAEVLDASGAAMSWKAVLLGGAAGSFVKPSQADVPLTFDGVRAIGATLGSGVVMVLDDRVDLGAFMMRIAAFFRDESCGQCVPCRVGTVRQEEALSQLLADRGARRDHLRVTLADVAQVMTDASICGLGQTAANAIASGLELWEGSS